VTAFARIPRQNHISGFATENGNGSGDIIASLKPKVVAQPWTERPRAAAGLKAAQQFAQDFLVKLQRLRPALGTFAERELLFVSRNNTKNASALNNLRRMAAQGRAVYVHCGRRSGREPIPPGVRVHVLSPAAREYAEGVCTRCAIDPNVFWRQQRAILA